MKKNISDQNKCYFPFPCQSTLGINYLVWQSQTKTPYLSHSQLSNVQCASKIVFLESGQCVFGLFCSRSNYCVFDHATRNEDQEDRKHKNNLWSEYLLKIFIATLFVLL